MKKIYRAKQIYTMDPTNPLVNYIELDGDIIVGLGQAESSKIVLKEIDNRFSEKTLLPGFIEGHSHATEGTFWRHVYCGYFDRVDPDGKTWYGLHSIAEVIQRIISSLSRNHQPILGWGIDPIYFDSKKILREDLDLISKDIQVGLIHASCHIVYVNSMSLMKAGLLRQGIIHPGIVLNEDGYPTGELRGPEAISLVGKILGINNDILGCDTDGLLKFAKLCVKKGITTASDFANPLGDALVKEMLEVTSEINYPIRLVSLLRSTQSYGEKLIQRALKLKALSTNRLRLGMIKIVVDGSIQGFTARLRSGRFYNGAHNGLWYITKENLVDTYLYALKHGVQVHTHTNGDQATELAIECMESVMKESFKHNHRFTIQHCQLADEQLLKRIKSLGMCINFFANHVYYWGDQHALYTVGPEYAKKMNPCATALSLDIPIAIHSDAPITPIDPLFTAWCAVNRKTATGSILGKEEKISVTQALYAITMGAAYTLGLEHEVGSIEIGKKADFAILDVDPYAVPDSEIRHVPVWGTIQGGRIFQANKSK
ncbi:COG1574 Predicted metal-dependent hydrolase with the TIM-barrel fold [Burkholderiaceae bacterium]|jgi:predicted amidohydrolase YtcJ